MWYSELYILNLLVKNIYFYELYYLLVLGNGIDYKVNNTLKICSLVTLLQKWADVLPSPVIDLSTAMLYLMRDLVSNSVEYGKM